MDAAAHTRTFERSIHLLYVPTLCCNLSCSYCYLGKQTSEAALKRDAQQRRAYAAPYARCVARGRRAGLQRIAARR
jgi:sulfatase maturation enzyme AslB (radical SAM superfamily)